MNDMAHHNFMTHEVTSRQNEDWWRGAVIYQIYPRSFQDSNGDGIGDLAGITSRLGYIAELGVDAIWVSPFFTSPMKDFGYDVSNYRDVDPIFGTLADFDNLVNEAHRLGLKVLIDQVLSHTSDMHHWFVESRASRNNPKADWYVWANPKPDGTPPNNWLSIFGGSAWEWDSNRRQYYLHNFLIEQPDLNFHNLEVQSALLDEVKFWLDRGVDGFRLDTVNFFFHSQSLKENPALPPESHDFSTAPDVNPYNFQSHLYDKSQPENLGFLRRFRALLDQYPGATSIGEVGDAERQLEIMAEYTSGNDKLHMCYTFDFLSQTFSRDHVQERVAKFETLAQDGWACWAFSNHDVRRHVSRWMEEADVKDAKKLAKLSASLLLSLRGSVCIYQGEELGLSETELAFEDLVDPYGIRFWPKYKGRDGCRTPMPWQSGANNCGFTTGKPWLPLSRDHTMSSVDIQQEENNSVLAHYKKLLDFRKEHAALKTGTFAFIKNRQEDHDTPILAFQRNGNHESVLCVFNLSETAKEWVLPEGTKVSPFMQLDMENSIKNNTIYLQGLSAFFGRIE